MNLTTDLTATVAIDLPHHRYEVRIEPGILDRLGAVVREQAPHARAALMADANVFHIYGAQAGEAVRRGGYELVTATIPPGEEHKTLNTVQRLYDVALDHHLERRSPIVALGGGVVGDTVGFVAATYLRGVPFVQCPTSLLAMVDSSVGGKVGVNVPQGKNLIGAFYQPQVVVIDPLVLQTLPPRELRCGLAECIKHGMIRDETLLEFIAENVGKIQLLKVRTTTELVRRNVAIKAAVVMEDEKESGVRAHLNFGHTFAHAIEATAGYGRILHGEAVSLGMVAATNLAVDLGMCQASVAERLIRVLDAVGLPVSADLPATTTLLEAMKLDKKVKDSRIRFVLPEGIGRIIMRNDVPEAAVAAAWQSIGAK